MYRGPKAQLNFSMSNEDNLENPNINNENFHHELNLEPRLAPLGSKLNCPHLLSRIACIIVIKRNCLISLLDFWMEKQGVIHKSFCISHTSSDDRSNVLI